MNDEEKKLSSSTTESARPQKDTLDKVVGNLVFLVVTTVTIHVVWAVSVRKVWVDAPELSYQAALGFALIGSLIRSIAITAGERAVSYTTINFISQKSSKVDDE